MKRLVPFPVNTSLGLLLIRLMIAAVFLYHGIPKIHGFNATVEFFGAVHIPMPAVTAAIVTAIEVGGGLAMLLGIATDLAGILIALDMVGAIATVHGAKGFDFTAGGWEHPFTMLVMALAIVAAGPGNYVVGGKRS